MNRFMIVAVLLMSTLSVASTMAIAQDDPAAILQKAVDSIARGDVEAALALYADDAVVEASPVCNRTTCAGKAAIRKRIERMVKGKAKDTITANYPSGNVVTSRVEHRSNRMRQAGVERIIKWAIVEIKGDKIVSQRNLFERSDPQTARFLKWQEEQRRRRAR